MHVARFGAGFMTTPLPPNNRGPQQGRLVLVESKKIQNILWLTPEELQAARQTKNQSISLNIGKIAEALPNIIARTISTKQEENADVLRQNMAWINARIASHNKKLTQGIAKYIAFFVAFFSKIFPALQHIFPTARPYEALSLPEDKLNASVPTPTPLSPSNPTSTDPLKSSMIPLEPLLPPSQKERSQGTSLLDEEGEKITGSIEDNPKDLLNKLQFDPTFRLSIKQCLQPKQNSLCNSLEPLSRALQTFESYPSSFQAQKGFLQTLLFIEKNRGWMENREEREAAIREGRVSVSHRHAHILKIKGDYVLKGRKEDIPYTIAFDRRTGKVMFLQHQLNQGFFKKVKKVLRLTEHDLLAVGKQTAEIKLAENELALAKECKESRNVAKLEGRLYRNKQDKAIMLTEAPFYDGGDLFDFIQNGGFSRLSQRDQLAITGDIIRGACHIHNQNIIHRDLKLENIFLTHEVDPNTGRVRLTAKIADFGLAYKKRPQEAPPHNAGTPEYVAPETWSGQSQNEQSDTWAIGVLLHLCHRSQWPYSVASKNPADLHQAGTSLQSKPIPQEGRNSIPGVIWGLTRPNPAERWTLTAALAIVESL